MQIKAGTLNTVETADAGSAVAIHLADEPSDVGELRTWRIEVFADRGEGVFYLGDITTRTPALPPAAAAPPLPPQPRTRIVAVCGCPGATRWVLRVRWAGEGVDGLPATLPQADVNLIGAPTSSAPGVFPVNERYNYLSGAAPATFTLARGQRVESWAAFSTGAGATVTINGGTPIPIPSGGTVRGDPQGTLDGGLFEFVGATLGGYFVESKES